MSTGDGKGEMPSGETSVDGPSAGGSLGWLDRVADQLDRWSERVSFELFRFGIWFALPALVVLVTVDVALRYVFNAPLQWGRDANGLLLLTAIFCTLPHVWDRAYHIRMEVFYSRFRRETRERVDVVSAVAGIVFFGLIAVQGARFVPFMIRTGETGEDLSWRLWPFMAVLSACSVVMVMRIFSNPAAKEERLRHRLSDRAVEPPAPMPSGTDDPSAQEEGQ